MQDLTLNFFAAFKDLDAADLDFIREGKVILIYKHLQTSVCLTLLEYISYKTGHYYPSCLADINAHIGRSKVRK